MVGDLRKQQVNNGADTAAGLKLPTQHIAARNPSKCCGFEKNNLNFPEINIFSHHVASITRPLDHQIGSKIPVQKLRLQCLSE